MLRWIAAATLAAFTLLVSVDGVRCADGCTADTDHPASTQSVPHDATPSCVLCILGVEAPGLALSLEPIASPAVVTPALTAWLLAGSPISLDHPPRHI